MRNDDDDDDDDDDDVFSVVAVVRAACPDNAIEKAMMCTAGLGFGPPTTSNNAFVERIEMVKQACR